MKNLNDWAFNAVYDAIEFKKEEHIDLLIQMLRESEQAKQALRDKGYGWTGLSLLRTVIEEVPINYKNHE